MGSCLDIGGVVGSSKADWISKVICKGWGFCHHSCNEESIYEHKLKMVKLTTLPDDFCKVIILIDVS